MVAQNWGSVGLFCIPTLKEALSPPPLQGAKVVWGLRGGDTLPIPPGPPRGSPAAYRGAGTALLQAQGAGSGRLGADSKKR